jgi:two-component system response regulator (stage 0 sporulation protein F)
MEHWMSEAVNTRTILIVDDEERLGKALARSFSEENYRTLNATTGEAAIDLLKNRKVDLVITDLVMPGMDGMTLVKNARKMVPEIKIVIITAYGSAESMREAKELGVAHYLAKPFDLADLKSKVRELLLVAGARASSGPRCPSSGSRRSALCAVCLASGRALSATVGLSRKALVYVGPRRVLVALGRATRAVSGLASVFTRR